MTRQRGRVWYPENDAIEMARDVVFTGRTDQMSAKEKEFDEVLFSGTTNASEEEQSNPEPIGEVEEDQLEPQVEQREGINDNERKDATCEIIQEDEAPIARYRLRNRVMLRPPGKYGKFIDIEKLFF